MCSGALLKQPLNGNATTVCKNEVYVCRHKVCAVGVHVGGSRARCIADVALVLPVID